MRDFVEGLAQTLIGVVAAKALDEIIERLKEKTSKQPGKHAKRP